MDLEFLFYPRFLFIKKSESFGSWSCCCDAQEGDCTNIISINQTILCFVDNRKMWIWNLVIFLFISITFLFEVLYSKCSPPSASDISIFSAFPQIKEVANLVSNLSHTSTKYGEICQRQDYQVIRIFHWTVENVQINVLLSIIYSFIIYTAGVNDG